MLQDVSLTGRVCLVTGANAGIGKATAQGLALRGARVLMVCRSRERGEAARDEINQATTQPLAELCLADLASRASIRALADDLLARNEPLHVLVNNAGIIPKERRLTEDGLEMQLAVNHLAPFLLTHLLLPRLRESAPARVINVASMAHKMAEIDFDDLQSERYSRGRTYARTKLANILFTYELARRLAGTGVTANCLHPGTVGTNLLVDFTGRSRLWRHLARRLTTSVKKGAATSIYLAGSPEVEGVSGKYFMRCREAISSPASCDRQSARRLWEMSEELIGEGHLEGSLRLESQ